MQLCVNNYYITNYFLMSYVPVTYHELITHADDLGIRFIPWDYCRCSYKLGAGASMNVFSGTYKVNDVIQNVAFKFVKARLTGATAEKKRSNILRDVKQEIRIMGRLKGHSRIVQLLGVSFDDHTPILILELAKSNLEEYLQENYRVKWKIKLGFMYDIALGLEAIHKAEVVHGDLKAANILVYESDNNQMTAKISDFGFSLTDLSVQEGRKPGFSNHFRSRECFDLELRDWDGKHTTDVYSYGLVVYQIAHEGSIPFEDYDESDIDKMKRDGTDLILLMKLLPEDTPAEVRNIITATVRNVPSDRSSLDEIKSILKESTERNQVYSYEEAKTAFESMAQVRPLESILISKMNELPIPSSLKKSIFLEYQRLADTGDSISQARLGSCWLYGFGTEKNDINAVKCYEKSAEAGNVEAQSDLGFCYDIGYGVIKNYIKAVELYTKAADAGNEYAQFNLASCYYNGHGVTKDYVKAVELYTKSAEAGNSNAQCNLGLCYENGEAVAKDYIKAVELYKKAAEAGNVNAQNNLGLCYYYGHGVTKDYIKAIELYTKAAEVGDTYAQINLAECYFSGHGVTRDYCKAVEFYRKAAEGGNANARLGLVRAKHHLALVERTE